MTDKKPKYHLSLRVDMDIAERINALRGADESQTGVYNRVLAAGVSAIEHSDERADDETDRSGNTELIDALTTHIDTLTAQLEVKDRQLANLGDALKAAQTLHMQAAAFPLLEPVDTPQAAPQDHGTGAPENDGAATSRVDTRKRRGLFSRIFNR